MKKLLLLSGFSLFAFGLSAQQARLALYEEFTGENCGPCAATNPGLMQTVNGNDDILIIKYQVPIPSGGPIYQQNTVDPMERRSYYGVNSAPWGMLDGHKVNNQSHPGYLEPSHLVAAANVPPVVELRILNYNRVLGSNTVNFDVEITSLTAQTFSDAVLHVGLIESLFFDTPPGTNGETEFYNVVRKMYPSPNGQAIQTSFAANESQTISFSATIPSYVDPNNADLRFFAFVQDNTNKDVLQAAVTGTVDKDAYSLGLESEYEGEVLCGAVADIEPTSKFRNVGNETITSAKIFYRTIKDNNPSAWLEGTWTGNLEPGQSTEFTFTGLPGEEGSFIVQDSIGEINGQATINTLQKSSAFRLSALSQTQADLFPYANTFESSESRSEIISAGINGGVPFNVYSGSNYGYGPSNYFLAYLNYQTGPGSQGLAILPYMNLPEGYKALSFYVAYKQYQNENDKLEVVYSTDCGQTWTSVWSKSGADLAAGKAPTTGQYLPNSSDYVKFVADLSEVPQDAYLALKATSDYGNNLFVDNISVNETDVVSTTELSNEVTLSAYPNPASENITLEINNINAKEAKVSVYDVMGRVILEKNYTTATNSLKETLQINNLNAGIYTLQIVLDNGTSKQIKFTKK